MLKKGKKRISITVDAERLSFITKTLEERDYPYGSLSHYLDDCLADLHEYLGAGDRHNVDAILELEISRVGLKAALEQRGAKVIQWDEDDLKPRRR